MSIDASPPVGGAPRREAILRALSELQPPERYDEAALLSFVGARQRLLDELAGLGPEIEQPLSADEAQLRAAASASAAEAMRVTEAEHESLLAATARHRRSLEQARAYGAERAPQPSVKSKG